MTNNAPIILIPVWAWKQHKEEVQWSIRHLLEQHATTMTAWKRLRKRFRQGSLYPLRILNSNTILQVVLLSSFCIQIESTVIKTKLGFSLIKCDTEEFSLKTKFVHALCAGAVSHRFQQKSIARNVFKETEFRFGYYYHRFNSGMDSVLDWQSHFFHFVRIFYSKIHEMQFCLKCVAQAQFGISICTTSMMA